MIKILLATIRFLEICIDFLEKLPKFGNPTVKYYVYNRLRNKPLFVHDSFCLAVKEAKRLSKICREPIEVLEIVCTVGNDDNIPF